MAITLSHQDYSDLFEEAIENGEIISQSNEFETICEYPPQLGQGYRQDFQLRPGLELSIDNHVNREHLIRTIPECQWSIGSYFHLSGNFNCDCGVHVDAGHHALTGSYAAPKETIEYLAGERFASVYIRLNSHLLETLIAGQLDQLPPALESLVEGGNKLIHFPGTMSLSMQVALQQILQCPYQGMFKRMYLESKVLELMALQFMQVVKQNEISHSYSSLRASDLDCIHHAKAILIQNLENPPSLLDLARQVGINDRKLKQGFHQVFNTTPFAYLRDYRLERARQLLTDSELPIEQVAKAVGYADRSRFATAFRKKFGVNPKTYQLQWRREI
jgi:AraC-like DNA-binding protein